MSDNPEILCKETSAQGLSGKVYHQIFPGIKEFKKMVYSLFKESVSDREAGAMIIDDDSEYTEMYYHILGDDAVIWYQELEVDQKQNIYVHPNPAPEPLYLFKFMVDQNHDLQLLGEDGGFRNKNLVLCNSLGSHGLTLSSGYRGKILQMIVTHNFLSEYVPQDYLQHSVIKSIIQKKETKILIIEHPPQYLQSELLKMAKHLKEKPGKIINKLKLLQLTARFIDSFFRLYLGEMSQGNFLPDQDFKTIVKEYFQKHIYEGFPGIENLAIKLHVSASTFKRRFSINFNTSPLQYFKKIQMDKARTEILQNESIENVAFKFGFSSTSNFIRSFKKYHNCTPGSLLTVDKGVDIRD